MIPKVGFVGLGIMGKPMATNLIKKGYDLIVYDILKEPVNDLKQLGAKAAKNSKELAAASEVIFSMVRDDTQTKEIMWGKDGVLDGVHNGSTIIITSTVSPALCRRLSNDVDKKGIGVLDSPVSGAATGAEAGTLTLMIGGDESLFKEMEPVLQAISQNRFFLGDVGMGQVAKLANNMILFSIMAGTTEGLAFGTQAGISLQTMLHLVKTSTGNSWMAQNWDLVTMTKKDHSPTATLRLIYKDLKLGLDHADEIGVELPMISQLNQIDLWREVA